MSEEMLGRLGEQFPPQAIKQRQGGGSRSLSYVETHTVIRRLNHVAVAWDWRINRIEFQEFPDKDRNGNAITGRAAIVMGTLTIPGLGSRDGIGIQKWDPVKSEDLVKGASGDALKKAATLFGVALELYGPDYEDADAPQEANRPQPARQPARAPQTPQRATQAPQQASPATQPERPKLDPEAPLPPDTQRALVDHAQKHEVPWPVVVSHAKAAYELPEGAPWTVAMGRDLWRWIEDQAFDRVQL